MEKGVLIDLTRCIGCRACQAACKEWNERSARKTIFKGDYTNPVALSSDCYTRIRFVEIEKERAPVWSFVKDQCLHCREPACVSACLVGALRKTQAGPVVYDYDRCMGCRYCLVACPFQVPKYEWESAKPWVQKCGFCSERIRDGLIPACIKVCPTKSMFYGDYDQVLAEAQNRINSNPEKYVNHIYGREEAGGTSWMYISNIPFEDLGFKKGISKIPYPSFTWQYLSQLPLLLGIVLAAGAGAWLITRRNEVSEKEGSG